jgi:hypothetical protein
MIESTKRKEMGIITVGEIIGRILTFLLYLAVYLVVLVICGVIWLFSKKLAVETLSEFNLIIDPIVEWMEGE